MSSRNYLILLLIICLQSCTNLQVDRSSIQEDFYSKMTFHNDVLIKVNNTDENGNKIFEKENQYVGGFWNEKYVTWLNANKFDEEGRVEFKIYAHSNTGFKIYFPERMNDSTEVVMIIEDGFDEDSTLVNKNQFVYINEINNSSNLINHQQIQKMLQYGNKYHYKTSLYDSIGNIVKEVFFEETGDTSSLNTYVFDETRREIFSNYNEDYEYYESFDSLGNNIESKRVNFKNRNGQREIDYIEIWSRVYTEDNKLKKVIKSIEGEIISIEIYEYENSNLVNEVYLSVQDGKEEIQFETKYFYMDDVLTEQVEINHRDTERCKKVITYLERQKTVPNNS